MKKHGRPTMMTAARKRKARRLHAQGHTDGDIAERIGVSHHTVWRWRRSQGLARVDTRGRNLKIKGRLEQKARWLHARDMSDMLISEALHLSYGTVRSWRQNAGLPPAGIRRVRQIDLGEHAKRLRLHKAGKSDREMGEILGLTRAAIHVWRKKHELPTRGRAAEEARRREALAQGLTDREIAAKLGLPQDTVASWRRRRGLPPHREPPPHGRIMLAPEKEAARMKFYRQGLNDREIARKLGGPSVTIAAWRYDRNLAANRSRSLPEGEHKKRLRLYRTGLTDAEIGRCVGRGWGAIFRWRHIHGLQANHAGRWPRKD